MGKEPKPILPEMDLDPVRPDLSPERAAGLKTSSPKLGDMVLILIAEDTLRPLLIQGVVSSAGHYTVEGTVFFKPDDGPHPWVRQRVFSPVSLYNHVCFVAGIKDGTQVGEWRK